MGFADAGCGSELQKQRSITGCVFTFSGGALQSGNEMSNVAGTKIACGSCGCAEFLQVRMRNENDTQMAVIENITSSNSKKHQVSEVLTSVNCQPTSTCPHAAHHESSTGSLSHSLSFALTLQLDLQNFLWTAGWSLLPDLCTCDAKAGLVNTS